MNLAKHVFACCVLLAAFPAEAHRIEYYTTNGCITIGQPLVIDAKVIYAPSNTQYRWQYKDNSGVWTCFTSGNNTINGTVFSVSNVSGTGADNAPELTIASPTAALANVQLRCLMREGANPCGAPAGTTYGGDDLALSEVKVLRLSYNSTAGACDISCASNVLTNSDGYYGGFEAVSWLNEVYTDKNFLSGAGSTALSTGGGTGSYKVMNNPYAAYGFTGAKFAPHGGNYQMIIKGNTDPTARVWYKTLSVLPGQTYSFSVWASRVDAGQARIRLAANGAELSAVQLTATAGTWTQVIASYSVPPGVTSVTFAITDKDAAAAAHNYVLDDICLVKTGNPVTIGDRVWYDADKDGAQDAGETGVSGVTVRLFYDDNSDNIADSANATYTTVTDAAGMYVFTGVIPGRYFVQFSLPAGYSGFTIQDAAGVPVGQNSTANTGTGKTGTHLFTTDYLYKDAGLIKPPDLSPTTDIDDLNFMPGASRDMVINLYEINNAATSGTITFRITKPSGWNVTVPGITLSATDQSGVSGTSAVYGGTANENGNWLFRETAAFVIVTSKPGIKIAPGGSVHLGFTLTRKPGIPNNTTQNITVMIADGSGGELNATNNSVVTSITANP